MKYLITKPRNEKDLLSVLDMQIRNHKSYLLKEEWKDGYVTLLTPLSYLKTLGMSRNVMMAHYPDSDICYAGTPAGYLIWLNEQQTMGSPFMSAFAKDVKKLVHDVMFNVALIAQVGVHRREAGKKSGIGKELYEHLFNDLKENHNKRYTHIATEVSSENHPSIEFHKKMGFETLNKYKDGFGNNMFLVGKTF